MFILLGYGYFGYLHDIVITQTKYDSVVKIEKRFRSHLLKMISRLQYRQRQRRIR